MKAGFPISKIIASNTIFGPLVDYHGCNIHIHVISRLEYMYHRYGATAHTTVYHRYGATAYTTVPQIWSYSLHYCTTDIGYSLHMVLSFYYRTLHNVH